MEQHLPDEILSEILTPSLSVSDTDFSDTSVDSPFASYSGHSASVFLLVSKSWLRVSTPLLYYVVVLRSKAQAAALAAALKVNPDLGRFIKKLRVEGGFGAAMHPILKGTPNVTDLVLTMDIWSSDSTSGLCRGLSLINPRRVILRGSGRMRTNKATTDLTENVVKCISEWSNLTVCDIGTFGHIKTFADSLARSKTIHTLLFPSSVFSRHSLPSLCRGPSLKVVQITSELGPFEMSYKAEVDADPKLSKLIKYTVKSTLDDQSKLLGPVPSLNPSVRPMESASQDTRDDIWRHILSFAMHTDESELFDRHMVFWSRPPSFLPFLLVSKTFHRLALPYLYQCFVLQGLGPTVKSLCEQLVSNPALGSSVRRIYLPAHEKFCEDDMSSILPCADGLEVVKGLQFGNRKYYDLDQPKVSGEISPNSFSILAQTSGATLHTFSAHLYPLSTALPPTLFSPLNVLRSLELSAANVKFDLTHPLNVTDALASLEDLRLETCDPSLVQVLTCMDLNALRRVSFGDIDSEPSIPESFFDKHGPKLTTLRLDSDTSVGGDVLKSCTQLANLSIDWISAIHTLDATELFAFNIQHTRLAKILLVYPDYLTVPLSKNQQLKYDTFFQQFDQTTFPGLREIQVSWCEWPLNEREIAKSVWVPRAEMLLSRGINLLDKTGKRWIPRLKLKGSGSRK